MTTSQDEPDGLVKTCQDLTCRSKNILLDNTKTDQVYSKVRQMVLPATHIKNTVRT